MSVEQLEKTVLGLSLEDRRRFFDWLYEHEDELVPQDDIRPEVEAEVLRRRDEALAHPELLEPVTSEWFEKLKRKLADARSGKTSPR